MHIDVNIDTKQSARKEFEADLLKSGISKESVAMCLNMFDKVAKNYTFSRKSNSSK